MTPTLITKNVTSVTNLPELPPGYWWSTWDNDINLIALPDDKPLRPALQDKYNRLLLMAYVRGGEITYHEERFDAEMQQVRYDSTEDAVMALYGMVLLGEFAEYRQKMLAYCENNRDRYAEYENSGRYFDED